MLIGRTVLAEAGRNFGVSLVSTTGVAFFMLSITFLKRTPGVGLGFLVEVFPLFFPLALQFTVPLACLSSVTLTFGRMQGDGELTALAAAGISPATMVRPVLAAAATLALCAVLATDQMAPIAAARLRDAKRNIVHQLQTSFRSGLSDLDLGGHGRISFESFRDGEFLDVCLEWTHEDQKHFIRARRGLISVTEDGIVNLTLKDGRDSMPISTGEGEAHLRFAGVTVSVSLDDLTGLAGRARRRNDMQAWELAYVGRRGVERGSSARVTSASAMEELARRTALAGSAFFFAFVGIPLGVLSAKGGRVGAFLGALAPVLLVYFPLVIGGSNMARAGRLPAYPALWAGNVVLLVTGLVLLRRVVRP
jgi:lipopolysaccharide export system permease protein